MTIVDPTLPRVGTDFMTGSDSKAKDQRPKIQAKDPRPKAQLQRPGTAGENRWKLSCNICAMACGLCLRTRALPLLPLSCLLWASELTPRFDIALFACYVP